MEEAIGIVNDGVEFRCVRFFNSGKVYSNVKYKVQLSYEGGRISFKDVYIELTKIPFVGNFRVAHFKEPSRFEVLTNSKYITFMQCSFQVSYTPERNTGFMLHNDDLNKRLFWQFAVLRNGNSLGHDLRARDGVNITARISGLALDNREENNLLHLGAALSYRKPESEKYIIPLRRESHLAPKYATTGVIDSVNGILLLEFEEALVLNRFSAQGEFVFSNVLTSGLGHLKFPTFYTQVSYFLTKDSRVYMRGNSGFDRMKPKKNFGGGGAVAWAVALRFSDDDLTESINSTRLKDITVGINWYLNPVTRYSFNYVNANPQDAGKTHIYQMRFQVGF